MPAGESARSERARAHTPLDRGCARAAGESGGDQAPEHPETATGLNHLALLLHARGDYTAAEPLYRRALSIRESALDPEHPDTAASLNNLAVLLKAGSPENPVSRQEMLSRTTILMVLKHRSGTPHRPTRHSHRFG